MSVCAYGALPKILQYYKMSSPTKEEEGRKERGETPLVFSESLGMIYSD